MKLFHTKIKTLAGTFGGPSFKADTWEEAQALANTHGIPGLEVDGTSNIEFDLEMNVLQWDFDSEDRIKVEDIEAFLAEHRARVQEH